MENEEKCIGDMYLAAAFLSYKVTLTKVDRSRPRRQKFTFTKTQPLTIYTLHSNVVLAVQNATLEDLELNFASDTLMFPPSFVDSIRKIKSSLHADDSGDE